ncbi:prepilin peptidase [Candidatus Parcubacteria bacterium]|nr:MAG: prepilin peptidase [Candidatus Parcubacteria bacterium]
MNIIIYIFTFLFGACVGSFLNVVIYRLPRKRKFLDFQQRSKCPRCRHLLSFWDLIPVFSFIFLKGKCRFCRKRISWQYPLVELMTGLIFVLIYWQYGLAWQSLIGLIGVSVLIVLAFIDGLHKIVPDQISLPAIAIIFCLQILVNPGEYLSLILGGIFGATWFWLQWLISKGKWVGSGDIRLGALLGVFLGLGSALLAIFSAYIIGSLWAIQLLIRGKVRLKSQLPFGIFLGILGIVCFIFGPEVVSWYRELIGL